MLNCSINSKSIKTIAIGNFDGIHLGHCQLLKRLDENSALVVIEHNKGCLTPGIKRAQYVNHPIFFYHLDKVMGLSAKEFVELLKKDFINLKKIVIGYDFVFGHQRGGDAQFLKQYFEVEVIEQFCIDKVAVHSREVRELLKKDFTKALQFLGKNYEVEGFHIKGQGIASKQLVPTINLRSNYCLPKDGVYITKTFVNDVWHKSVSFVGHRKTTDGKLALETHLIDQDIDLNKQKVIIEFIEYIRENEKFESLQALKKQIELDIQKAKSFHEKR